MQQFVCGTCNQSFPLKIKLFQHKKKEHMKINQQIQENVNENVKCNSCEKFFSDKGILQHHMDSAHLKLKQKIKCENCYKTFASSHKIGS